MADSRSMTVVETQDEVPKPPKTYKMVLKMAWKSFKECCLSNNALDLQKKMKKERKAILNKIDKGEHISEKEREFLNSSFKQMLFSLFQNLEKCLLNYLELEENDSPELQTFKLLAATEVTSWLKNLDRHISKSLESILDPDLPENEMIAKTKKVLNDLKNEIKPENFSQFLSLPEDLKDTNDASHNPAQQSDPDISKQTNPKPAQQNDENETIWETLFFGDWFIL